MKRFHTVHCPHNLKLLRNNDLIKFENKLHLKLLQMIVTPSVHAMATYIEYILTVENTLLMLLSPVNCVRIPLVIINN